MRTVKVRAYRLFKDCHFYPGTRSQSRLSFTFTTLTKVERGSFVMATRDATSLFTIPPNDVHSLTSQNKVSFMPYWSHTCGSKSERGMAQSPAIRRLKKEYQDLCADPVHPGIFVKPKEINFLHAHFLLSGESFNDTPYAGGVYHGVLKFPPNYPMKPPSVMLYTPSGRFQVNRRICFSYSDFHPELWCPAWNIRTILIGLVSFMNSDEATTGEEIASREKRVEYAEQSLQHCLERDAEAKSIFGEELDHISQAKAMK